MKKEDKDLNYYVHKCDKDRKEILDKLVTKLQL